MERKHNAQIRPTIETVLALLVFIVLATYTYAKFFALPYAGIVFDTSNGELRLVFTETSPEESLRQGDLLIQVGEENYQDYKNDLLMTLFDEEKLGDVVQIAVQRDGQIISIPWSIPGWNQAEFLDRFNSVLILAYIFWITGMTTLILVRPRDLRWRLIVAFFFITSLWLAAGSLSAWHIWGSAVLLRVAIWLWMPVALHLHWVFPKPFRRLPASVPMMGYAIGILLALLQVFQLLPASIYFLGFIAGVLGSLILLLAHFILQPADRRALGFLAGATAIALLPPVVISLSGLAGSIPTTMLLGFLAMPVLPGAYFLAAFRRRLGEMEIRINRAISTYLFFILFGIAATLLVPVAYSWVDLPGGEVFVGISAVLLAGLLTTTGYPSFVRFVERRFLGIPLPPTHLVETYADRITTSLRRGRLVQLIRDQFLPSLLVRQSTLVRIEDENRITLLYSIGLDDNQLPKSEDISFLLAESGRYRPPSLDVGGNQPQTWMRLILPITAEGKLLGLWILGRRDPDDYYAPGEIDVLEAIVNQTAIALVNIDQAERLHALYQADIERHEQERSGLALDLHDDVLNQLAGLSMKMDEKTAPDFEEDFQAVTSRLRQMIQGLRPAMLNYGLAPALEDLADELSTRSDNDTGIQAEITCSSSARYDTKVEAHLYRIVQQACENALRHAQASSIHIHGRCDPEGVQLSVQDDGIGFSDPDQMDFSQLLADKHYGLANMFERAALIGAELQIKSSAGRGTQISVTWSSGNENTMP